MNTRKIGAFVLALLTLFSFSICVHATGCDHVLAFYANEGDTSIWYCTLCGETVVRDGAWQETPSVWQNPFIDIDENHSAYVYIRYVYENGLFSGIQTDAGLTFAPDMAMSRAMFVTTLGRLSDIDVDDYSDPSPFSDVTNGSWYAPYVAWAVESGIVYGYDTGAFGVHDAVTVEQGLTFLARYARYCGHSDASNYNTQAILASYPDSDDVAAWARTSVGWALLFDLYRPDPSVGILPERIASRALLAEILYRYNVAFGTT